MTKQTKKRIVILGGGFGGIYTYKRLHQLLHRKDSIELIIVSDKNYFLFTPLLHEVAGGSINPENIVEPIRNVLECCLSDLFVTQIKKIDVHEKKVTTATGEISYDYLVMALGSTTQFFETPGAEEYSLTLKNLEDALTIKHRLIDAIEKASHMPAGAERSALLHTVIVGGGPTGVELSTEIAEFFFKTCRAFYKKEIIDDVRITLVQRSEEVLPIYPRYVQKKARARLAQLHIKVLLQTSVLQVQKNSVTLDSGKTIDANTIIWVAGVKPQSIDINGSTMKSDKGCIVVAPTLQLADHPEVFILGDMAHCPGPNGSDPLPALAQVAVTQGACVAENIVAHMRKKKLHPFSYKTKGLLVSLGNWMAAGEIYNVPFSGRFAWWLWRMVYLSKLISWGKKIQVMVDWTIDLCSPRDISRY